MVTGAYHCSSEQPGLPKCEAMVITSLFCATMIPTELTVTRAESSSSRNIHPPDARLSHQFIR
jgi:hypothetical protein